MKQFTIPQLREVLRLRYSLTKDKYVTYAIDMFGLSEKEAVREWKILFDIQRIMIVDSREWTSDEQIDQVLSHAFSIKETIEDSSYIETPYRCDYESSEEKKLVYYSEPGSEKVIHTEIYMNRLQDIIRYAEILKRGCDIKIVLDYAETINISNEWNDRELKTEDIYIGDIISCMDDSRSIFGNDSGVYLCEGRQKGYSQLLYTKGKGYIRNGKPDRDEKYRYMNYKFNSYNRKYMKIGNIYLDASVLVEGKPKDE